MRVVDKYVIPDDLCDHIVEISEDYISRLDMANGYLIGKGLEPLTPVWDDDEEEAVQLEFFTGRLFGV